MKKMLKITLFAALTALSGAVGASNYGPITIDTVKAVIQHNGVNKDTLLLRAVIDGNSDETLSITEDVVVSEVVVRRKFLAGKPQTMVLPFSISNGSWRAQPLKFWRYVGMEQRGPDWIFKTNSYSNDIDANTPFVVTSEQDADSIVFNMSWKDNVQYGNVTMNTTAGGNMEVEHDDWIFKGTYSRIDWVKGHKDLGYVYGFSAKNKGNVTVGQFVKAAPSDTSHPYIRSMRGYLFYSAAETSAKKVSSTASVGKVGAIPVDSLPQTIEMIFDDSDSSGSVGIGRMNTVTGEMTIDHWVDMKGRKLDSRPSAKGVYYNNRKKVIVK